MKTSLSAVLTAAVFTSMVACGTESGSGSGSASGGIELVESGSLTACTDSPYKPFEYPEKSAPSGYTGFDVEIMDSIAKAMKLELKVKDLGFDGLQSGASLSADQCDVVMSAMTITDAREAKLDFTDAYYDSKQSLLTSADSGITSLEDLAGKKIGVQQGTTGAEYAKANVPKDAKLVSFPSDAELYVSLESGGVVAVLQDLPVNLEHTKGGTFENVEEYETDEQYGFAVQEKGSEELLKMLNRQLKTLRDNGTYEKLYAKYFKA